MKTEYWYCTERTPRAERAAQGRANAPLGWLWPAMVGLSLAGSAALSSEAKVFDVRQYGAKGDGRGLDTVPIQKALDEWGQAGGGVVRIPSGTYLSRPIEIDGSGARWWEPAEAARRKVSGYTLPRPNLVRIVGCKNLKVTGITLQNSPKFHLVPEDCEGVRLKNVSVTAKEGPPFVVQNAEVDGLPEARK